MNPFYQIRLAGAFNILYGSPSGLAVVGSQFWHQDSPGIKGKAAFFEFFASVLASADFNGDGYTDLAATALNEVVDEVPYAGAVNVLYGGADGLTAARNQLWTEASPGVPDAPEEFDSFGQGLAAGDFDRDGFNELAVGVPGDRGFVGAVHILRGAAGGLTSAGSQFWHQGTRGIKGSPRESDRFGSILGGIESSREPTER